MSDQLRKWFPVLFLLLLAALSYWLENKVKFAALSDVSKRHIPDAIVENFTATKFGLDGKPRQTLSAQVLFHFLDDSSSKLIEPHLLLVSPGQANIRVRSNWAWLSENGEDVYLHDKVEVIREAYGVHSKMDMTTEYLHLNADKHEGETNLPVRIQDPKTDVHAVGMTFNDETRVVNLLSHVHVDYEK